MPQCCSLRELKYCFSKQDTLLGLVGTQQNEPMGKYSQLEDHDQKPQPSSEVPGCPRCTAQALC